jgi:4-carboxymuconolactone decarboxylase
MDRLPRLSRDDLDADGQRHFDKIFELRNSAGGLYGLLLHSPGMAARMAATEAYVRFEAPFPDSLKEMVILATAREARSQYEYQAHARLARGAGVSDDAIRALARGKDPVGLTGDEGVAIHFARELVRDRKVTHDIFQAAVAAFGRKGVVELTVMVGHYLMIDQFLAALEVEIAPGAIPELPLGYPNSS